MNSPAGERKWRPAVLDAQASLLYFHAQPNARGSLSGNSGLVALGSEERHLAFRFSQVLGAI